LHGGDNAAIGSAAADVAAHALTHVGVGESDTDCMRFPALSLTDAIGLFTEAVYGHRMDFEHA